MRPSDCKYTEQHEWVQVEGEIATIGISDYAAEELGDIVFVELPEVGSAFSQMDEFGTVESVKTVSSLFLPVGGEIIAVNTGLAEEPATVSESPFSDGWLVKVKLADPKEVDDLMDNEEYEGFLETV